MTKMFYLALLLGLQEPVQTLNVPHHNLNVEQTQFAVSNFQESKAGIISLNSKGVYFYPKQSESFGEAQSMLPIKTRAEDRHWLGVGDFDKDGKEDIAYVVNHILHVRKNCSETFIPSYEHQSYSWEIPHEKTIDSETYLTCDKEKGFVADMDNDGFLDIVLNNATGCYLFQNNGNLQFETTKGPTIIFPKHKGEWGLEPAAIDWNSDGKLDVIMGSSEGIFVALNKGAFGYSEKIAEVNSPPHGENLDNYINNPHAEIFPFVPQSSYEDIPLIRIALVEGKKVPVVGTYYGFFKLGDKIERMRLRDKQNNFLSHLKFAAGDHVDFDIKENKIVYATKAGFFCAKYQDGFYVLNDSSRIEDGGYNDAAYLLSLGELNYVVGTSKKLHFFNEVQP